MMLAHTTYTSNHQPHPFYCKPQQQQEEQHQHQQRQHPTQVQRQQQFQLSRALNSLATSNPNYTATIENLPTAAAAIAAATQQYRHTAATLNNQRPDLMSSDRWMLHGQQTPTHAQQQQQQQQQLQQPRFGHKRDSSLSSVSTNAPTTPYNANTTENQIGVTDNIGDGFNELSVTGGNNYTYAMTKPVSETYYTNTTPAFTGNNDGMGDLNSSEGPPGLTGARQQRQTGNGNGNGLALNSNSNSDIPPALNPSTRSRPVSVASSIVGGDSPATPSFHDHEDDPMRSKNGEASDSSVLSFLDSALGDLIYNDVYSHLLSDPTAFTSVIAPPPPKLGRTMTDIYNDELYNPNFTITSASPPQTHVAVSPTNEIFAQTLQAANSQHLCAAQSPMTSDSRDRSPFRQDSPYASAVNELPKLGTNRVRLESAQQQRERIKAEEDAKQVQQQMARHSQQKQQQQCTPNTISPRDAMLEFNETDAANFPLFPTSETSIYDMEETNGNNNMDGAASQQQSTSAFQSLSTTTGENTFNFSMPANIQVSQQFPFMSRQQSQQHQQQQQRSQQQHSQQHYQQQQQQLTPSASSFSRMSSAEASNSDVSSNDGQEIRRPERTAAGGGTYTCTYHGCTLRFETPALLQKHKKDIHRQINALNHLRSPVGIPVPSAASSQAGPHRCDRLNPSTGKPCNTIFSRPYDLTRHEDTIHNARKQKVRCDICAEEKTFSRADALTRHYRVCHPDVEVPGKHRRRGI